MRNGRCLPVAPHSHAPQAPATAASPVATRSPVIGHPGPEELPTWSDSDLVEAVVLRSSDAYAELRRRHFSSVTATSRMILGRGPGCDDVVSDVFTALWLRPDQFDPSRGTLLAYLRMTARGRSIDLVRSESARRRRELADLPASSTSRPEADEGLLGHESDRLVRATFASLSTKERDVLHLAFFRGMSYTAVAVHLGLPEGTVKSRIRSGLLHLRRSHELADYWNGRGASVSAVEA